MVSFTIDFNQICFEIITDLSKDHFHCFKVNLLKHIFAVLGNEDQMNMKIENTVPS